MSFASGTATDQAGGEGSERNFCDRPKAVSIKSGPILSHSSLLRATLASLEGIRAALRSERAFRQETLLLVLALPASFALTPDMFRRGELIASLLAVLAVELLNTGIEKLCDHTTPHLDPHIKVIKDMGSAAVFCALGMAVTLWGAAAMARLGF
jgi:diacylglycerol kinase (ATP)